ncbi:hypothetical protein [Streptomyces gardneri]|uniref:Uncharacterized protein n=1 Tax=Streptomyces gardneri TaxID=66892 RepID=A0A4Y3RQV9_9ACTN|nr:hypothetical protein [Streptomyces gardneri]GEB59875.1 hypothetical protein SGA01_54800 [Streptomyces gardneri]GHG85839.1 hypothetical protein GCM10017674_10070 [Streptomyces gardneri]
MRLPPQALYLRSRGLPGALAALLGTAAAAAWAAWWLVSLPDFDHTARLPVVVLGPLLAAGVIGTSLHTPSDELDRTAVRAWWPRRLVHVLAPTALAVALLALALPGHAEEFGAPAAVRNTLGLMGVAAGATTLLGARLSWLPPTFYAGVVYLAAPAGAEGGAVWWAWVTRPGPEGEAWAVAAVAFAAGAALYAWRGSRRTTGEA